MTAIAKPTIRQQHGGEDWTIARHRDRRCATLPIVTDEASRILDAAMMLPEVERAEFAAILTDSISDRSSPDEVQSAWIAEAKRRLAAVERGESTPVDFDDAMRKLRAKVRRSRDQQASTG